MTERSDRQREVQIRSKMHELIACMCVVTFKQGGDRRGMIERIESLAVGRDFSESFEQSQFKVHLTSGDVVVVAGSAISAIESTNANRQPNRRKKEPGKKARKARTKNPFTKKRKSIAAKATKAAATVRARKAKRRKAHNG